MESAHCTTISFLLPYSNATPNPRKPLLFFYTSTPFLFQNPTKRKNSLRPKLLKTLIKPLIPQQPLTNPIIPIESPPEQQTQTPGESEAVWSEIQFSETSDSAGVLEGIVGKFSTRSILKFGLYLVGVFVFQTICAVLLFGSADSDHKDGNLDNEDKKTRVLELGMNQNGKGKLGSGKVGILSMDESEMERKIVEIRAMAKEARQRERLEAKVNAIDEGDAVKTGIEEEVDNRLVKLRRRLGNDRGKLVVSSTSDLNKNVKVEDGVDKESLDANEAYRSLMFKKKYKFRGPSPQPGNKPKGFQGSKNGAAKMKNSTSSASEDQMKEQQLDLANGELLRSKSTGLEEDGGKKASMAELKSPQTQRTKVVKKSGSMGAKVGFDISESRSGVVQESSLGKPLVDNMEFKELTKLEARNSQEIQHTDTISNKRDVLSKNDDLTSGEIGRQAAGRARDDKLYSQSDLWWCSLPYVLAIMMRRGDDGEGPQGLFTLKSTSHTKDKDDSSHIVAFEDCGDATNFCYILQSFFEDLGDFSVDIVPILTNELLDDVKSHGVNVIVIKKGQLQLYAGQPLTDVEIALQSLVR